jgi:hypothetical protein
MSLQHIIAATRQHAETLVASASTSAINRYCRLIPKSSGHCLQLSPPMLTIFG